MAEYPQYTPDVAHDFELYSHNPDQHLDFQHNQSFASSSTYAMDPAFSAQYDPMAPLSHVSRHSDLQFHYDGIAQGVKPFHYQTPAGSPHSTSHSFHEIPPVLSASSESGASVSSSAMGSPSILPPFNDSWNSFSMATTSGYDYPGMVAHEKSYVAKADPNLIQPFALAPQSPYPEIRATPSPYFPVIEQPPSPALSHISSYSQQPGSARIKKGSASPYLHTQQYHPYTQYPSQRRSSVNSLHSQNSGTSRKSGSSYDLDDETREKGMCPLPECGRVFKDLKAHMLTHQNERPEKCPIATCEYHVKGFARKYDKNRHTLTHYKGTMVCGFCPGSGSAAEKSFNRADVFKRHLTSVHGVEQNPPNSRKKSPSGRKVHPGSQLNVAGTCSTCSVTFANAQEFYEHLDDCVLRVVQQTDPTEAINQRLLTSVAEDKDVTETLDRNGLSKSIEYTVPKYEDDEEEDYEEDEIDNDDQDDATWGSRVCATQHVGGGNPNQHISTSRVTKSGPRAGLTFSKGGVAITGSGRKKRKNYPVSWGCATDKMKMKKRVLCVYDGQRRLWKDDMMLDQEFEVRMKLPDGKAYVTDLDVQTLNRAEALHGATAEERGAWVPDNIVGSGAPPMETMSLEWAM
ncbi:zinc finger domain-containing protein [Stemphylium lycopersici]|nr:zinc finger domain-containing protein [Stemphylium lycopersici]RAR07520.1 zinc finger domain-containing protein [Stemphylium lycopersici]